MCYNNIGITDSAEKGAKMTWEIAVGMFGIISAFIAVMNVVVKINTTLSKLEAAVIQLKECMEHQSDKNAHFYTELSEHEKRLVVLEREWGIDR
jgi:hypothetical protein